MGNIGEPRREIVIEPIQEPKRVETPAPAEPEKVPA
jgi:hypothetical protein